MKRITKKEATQNLVAYYFDEEKRHLEEFIGTIFDVEDDSTDDELYKFCIDNDIEHVWTNLYILSR
jgi:hypothetical protein